VDFRVLLILIAICWSSSGGNQACDPRDSFLGDLYPFLLLGLMQIWRSLSLVGVFLGEVLILNCA
jgi:hypothetical protein